MAGKWLAWVKDRFGLGPIQETVLYRRVAKGSWYYGDGATLLLLLGVLVGTGAFLTLTYSPTPDAAYQSVEYITFHQTLGWFVRGLHYWSAGMMVVMVVFHLFRQILVGGYKSPREGTWLTGVVLFFCVMVMSFTGYLLRWDERALTGLRVVLHMFYHVPVIGDDLIVFVQGGPDVGARTVTRLYSVHVIFVPLLMFMVAGYHLYLVMLHGITCPSERGRAVPTAEEQKEIYKQDKESEERGEVFFPMTAAKSGAMGLVVFALVLTLTLVIGPQRLQREAHLVERSPAPEHEAEADVPQLLPELEMYEHRLPKEEWWFWWYSSLIAMMPPALAPVLVVLFPIVLFLALVSLPFVDRSPYRGILKRPIAASVVVLCVIALLYLTDLRRQSAWTAWPESTPPPVPPGIQLTAEVEQGRLLFAQYGCNSCHPVAGHGRKMAIDLAVLSRPYSQDEIRKFVLRPPEGVAMPAYEGRISDEDLESVVRYVHVAQTFVREQ